jgi:hypothetical protein
MWTTGEVAEAAFGGYENWSQLEEGVCEIVADEMSGRDYDGKMIIIDPNDHITLMLTVADGISRGSETSFRSTSAAALTITAFDWPSRVEGKKDIQYNIAARVKQLLKTDRRVECEVKLEGKDDWDAV